MTRSQILGTVFSLLIALAALATAVWVVATGQAQDLDALFLILVCLLFALLFSIPPVQVIRSGVLRQLITRRKAAPTAQQETTVSQTASQKS
jgi:hypothetical protein